MDQIEVKSGSPTFIEEIAEDSAAFVGKSVSVTGKLCEHWVETCTAKLSDPQTKQELVVDTALIEPFPAKFGSLFHMIGEMTAGSEREPGGLRLKARVVRCVDGLDLARYRRAVECQRNYFAMRETH